MEKKTLFEPEDLVKTLTGQFGLVVSGETLDKIRNHARQGRRPGHFFAPGCCERIDYLLQIPVFFEDGMYDIMKPMYIKKIQDDPSNTKLRLGEMLRGIARN